MSHRFRYFGGIDFSGAREPLSNLWSAVGEDLDGRLRIHSLRPHAYRADLGTFVSGGWRETVSEGGEGGGRILWGADFPFGLPAEVCGAIGVTGPWSEVLAWVADRLADEVKAAAGDTIRTPRKADTGGALAPLDLRLYKQTVEGLRWLHELREESEVGVYPQAPDATETVLIEVYPSVSVRDLNLPRRRSPNRPGQIRARVAAFKPYLEFATPEIATIAVTLEDAWDATIACLTAFLCRDALDQPESTAPGSIERIRREGWIYRAPAALETS